MPGWKAIAILGGLLGVSGVLLAALGSHAVPGMDDPATYRSWQSASLVQLVHAAALLGLAALARSTGARLLGLAGIFMALGTVLFSGSIHLRLLLELQGTGNLAPAGGLVLMAGWLLAIVGCWRN